MKQEGSVHYRPEACNQPATEAETQTGGQKNKHSGGGATAQRSRAQRKARQWKSSSLALRERKAEKPVRVVKAKAARGTSPHHCLGR